MAVVSRSHEPGLDTAENSSAAENCAHPCAHRSDTLPRPPIVLTIQTVLDPGTTKIRLVA